MAHIVYRPHPDDPPAQQLIINGIDYSNEVYRDVELIETHPDEPEYSEVGLRVTFAVSRLDLGEDTDVQITDHLPEVAQRVEALKAWSK